MMLEQLQVDLQQYTCAQVTQNLLQAVHPEHGRIGYLDFSQNSSTEIQVNMLYVEPMFRRQGVASWLMRHLEAHCPEAVIDHGSRSGDGVAWATHFYGTASRHTRRTRRGQPLTQSVWWKLWSLLHVDTMKP